jgi:hypothetical protein
MAVLLWFVLLLLLILLFLVLSFVLVAVCERQHGADGTSYAALSGVTTLLARVVDLFSSAVSGSVLLRVVLVSLVRPGRCRAAVLHARGQQIGGGLATTRRDLRCARGSGRGRAERAWDGRLWHSLGNVSLALRRINLRRRVRSQRKQQLCCLLTEYLHEIELVNQHSQRLLDGLVVVHQRHPVVLFRSHDVGPKHHGDILSTHLVGGRVQRNLMQEVEQV